MPEIPGAQLYGELMRGGRAFLVPLKETFWERLLQRPLRYDLLVFSNKTIANLPIQGQWLHPPKGLDSLQRHRWRVRHGLSYVTEQMQKMLRDRSP